MRWESGTLIAEQKKMTVEPWPEIVLTQGESSHSFYRTRMNYLEHKEQPFSHTAKLVLENTDKDLGEIDLKGYEAKIGWGLVTSEGEETSETAPLTVLAQQFESAPGKLDCTLELVGIPDLLAEDEAKASYIPDETDTKTIKTLITEILGASLACYAHCKAYEVVWGSLDDLMNNYQPKDKFRIYLRDSRLAKVRELLDNTKCVMRFRADGKIHIFLPVVSGEVYDYEHSLLPGQHTFFAKAYRKRLVIPNKIVVQDDEDDPTYSGSAVDQESIDALEGREFRRTFIRALESDAQGDEIAEAILSKFQMHTEAGAGSVPMNVCSELFDYVKVKDEREDDFRVGNIGSITRIYKPDQNQHEMRFSFGGWLSVRKLLKDFETYEGTYFSRLQAKHAYIENLLITNIDAAWIDPEGNIDLSQIGDSLDNLPDGENYAKVKTIHIDAGQIKLDEHVFYASGYNPTEKEREIKKQATAPTNPSTGDLWLDTSVSPNVMKRWNGTSWVKADPANIDDLPNGVTYKKVLSTDIQAGHIKLSSVIQVTTHRTVSDGEKGTWNSKMAGDADLDNIPDGTNYSRVLTTDISAGHIKLLSVIQTSSYRTVTDAQKVDWTNKPEDMDEIGEGTTYKRVKATDISAGHIKLTSYVNAAGEWYDYSGVEIDADVGVTIKGQDLILEAGGYSHYIYPSAGGELVYLSDYDGVGHRFLNGPVILSCDLDPASTETYLLGSSSKRWWGVWTKHIYREWEHDLQHLDDLALIRGMKADKNHPGFIDRATIPAVLLQKREEFEEQARRAEEANALAVRQELNILLGQPGLSKKERQRMTKELHSIEGSKNARVARAIKDFQPGIDAFSEISLIMGALRQVGDRLDALEAKNPGKAS